MPRERHWMSYANPAMPLPRHSCDDPIPSQTARRIRGVEKLFQQGVRLGVFRNRCPGSSNEDVVMRNIISGTDAQTSGLRDGIQSKTTDGVKIVSGEQENPAPTANEPSRASDGWGKGGFDMDTARASNPASIRWQGQALRTQPCQIAHPPTKRPDREEPVERLQGGMLSS